MLHLGTNVAGTLSGKAGNSCNPWRYQEQHMKKPLVEILKAFLLNLNSVYQNTDITVLCVI